MEKICFQRGKTRGKAGCTSGTETLVLVDFLTARRLGMPPGSRLCRRHYDQIRRPTTCCCPAPPAGKHSSTLIPCSSRFLAVFSSIQSRPTASSSICTSCHRDVDKSPMFNQHPQYTPPVKRTRAPAVLSTCNMEKPRKDLPTLVGEFQLALYRAQVNDKELRLYDPDRMEAFANKHAPGLWDNLLDSITRTDQRLDPENLGKQRKKVVTILYDLAYTRSQKTNTLHIDVGKELRHRGLSSEGLHAGGQLLYSASKTTVETSMQGDMKTLLEKNMATIYSAIKDKKMLILMLDDFHVIHTNPQPHNLCTSTAIHMATAMLNILQAPAVPLAPDIHCIAETTKKVPCPGGISPSYAEKVVVDIASTFHQSVRAMKPAEIELCAQKYEQTLKDFRTYCQPGDHDERCTLQSCILLDEWEQPLHSAEDYQRAILHVLELYPPLKQYIQQYTLLLAADWPGFFLPKKLLAHGLLPKGIFPRQGPFHISLNFNEHSYCMFKPIFQCLHKALCSGEPPQKPKYDRIVFLQTALFLGWDVIRSEVLEKFATCKDPELLTLLLLLEEVNPIAVLLYSVIFRGGNYDMWYKLVGKCALLFLQWGRHHYDRATLCHLTDDLYLKENSANLFGAITANLSSITEKPVEVFHSLLRRRTKSWSTAQGIQRTARTTAMRQFNNEFLTHLWPETNHPPSKDYQLVQGAAAKVLTNLLADVRKNLGQAQRVTLSLNNGSRVATQDFWLPSLQTNLPTKCMPLAYLLGHDPDQAQRCDAKCQQNRSPVVRLTCGHSYCCTTTCPVCIPELQKMAKDITRKFNESLLQSTQHRQNSTASEETQQEPEPTSLSVSLSKLSDEEKATLRSAPFRQELKETVKSWPDVTQPSNMSNVQSANLPIVRQRRCSYCRQQGHVKTRNGRVQCPSLLAQARVEEERRRNQLQTAAPTPTCPNTTNPSSSQQQHPVPNIKKYLFPQEFSQSTIDGRNGSNACYSPCCRLTGFTLVLSD
ncbi:hypothetical protein Bbelb_079870 [Branchiostoma belcheri]|nr:hypothetical protein Bbelb_079870 [Branchiostoma belcheri]